MRTQLQKIAKDQGMEKFFECSRLHNELKKLLEKVEYNEVELNKIDECVGVFNFDNVLNYAVIFKNLPIVQYLYDKYPEKISSVSDTPQNHILNLSCKSNAIDIARWIIEEKGAEVNTPGFKNLNAACSEKSSYDLVEYLLSKGADVNENYILPGFEAPIETPLYKAIYRQNFEIAELLLEKGAYIAKRDIWGKAPIHMAATNANCAMVKLLKKYGANLNEKVEFHSQSGGFSDDDGKTAAEILCEKLGITEEQLPWYIEVENPVELSGTSNSDNSEV